MTWYRISKSTVLDADKTEAIADDSREAVSSLGADSIDAGKIACVIGLLAVVIFMLLYYGLFGVVADIALILNLIIILFTLIDANHRQFLP